MIHYRSGLSGRIVCALALAALLGTVPTQALTVTETFSSDPLTGDWSFGVGDNSNSQYNWSNTAPKYTGDTSGSLSVNINSSLPTARLDRALGQTFNDTADFSLTTRFSFEVTSAPSDQFMQFAFGLTNSATTGGDRTGSLSTTADTFSTIEFDYYPNVTMFGGPTLTPTVFGADNSGDAFGNFASIFGPDADLGDNVPPAVNALPQNVNLQATLSYSAADMLLTTTVYQINGDGSLTELVTGVPALDLSTAVGYDSGFSFEVDQLSIMAYTDGYTTALDPSLVGTMSFDYMEFTTVPEPGSASLLALGAAAVLLRRRRH